MQCFLTNSGQKRPIAGDILAILSHNVDVISYHQPAIGRRVVQSVMLVGQTAKNLGAQPLIVRADNEEVGHNLMKSYTY